MAPMAVVFVRLLQHLSILLLCSLYILLPAGAQYSSKDELYVKPTEHTHCPAKPCYTLDTYVASSTQYFVNNTVFKFLPGNHSLNQSLVVTRVANLALMGLNGSVNVTCQSEKPSNPLTLSFNESLNVTLENLTLSSCGTLFLTDLLNLTLLGVSINESLAVDSHWVLKAANILGASNFTRLHITAATANLTTANVLLCSYTNQSSVSLPVRNHLTIKDSVISNFSGHKKLHFEVQQASYAVSLTFVNLKVGVTSSTQFNLTLLVSSRVQTSIVIRDSFFNGSNSSVSVTDHSNNSNTSVDIGNCQFDNVTFYFNVLSSRVSVEDSLFTSSSSVMLQVMNHTQERFLVRNVTFMAAQVYEKQVQLSEYGIVALQNVTNLEFSNCKFMKNTVLLDVIGSVVLLVKSKNIIFTNCSFYHNYGTPIASVHSTFILSGRNDFRYNVAYEGGALSFYGQSHVTLSTGSHTAFVDNSADMVGGAIYVDQGINTKCFFKLKGNYTCKDNSTMVAPPTMLYFENNWAQLGGNAVYGAGLDTCQVGLCSGWKVTKTLFHVNETIYANQSAITSDPLRVCLCENNKPVCIKTTKSHQVFPGQPFLISAAVVGDRFGTVSGQVYARIPVNNASFLGKFENVQEVDRPQCTNLTYTIFSYSSSASLALTTTAHSPQHKANGITIKDEIHQYNKTGEILPGLRTCPVYITLLLRPCPVGFVLSVMNSHCTCNPLLKKNHIRCDITTQSVQRTKTEWVSVSPQDNKSVIVSRYCPNDYCKPEAVKVILTDPDSIDTQCAFNRSGILCGYCQAGLSLALGSPRCIKCSNDYLTLLIPFALTGFALVFFIKLLNLTVAQGTMNSLIFYANIVRANHVQWIPNCNANILTVFIAWLNLDLGIETCFISGLDAYWKTWLQFVFPLYIWVIVILIIILSRYSSTAAKIFGHNSVPVLATLFLLSYPKLLRTIISIFHISILEYQDGQTLVWSYDGNVPYFSPKHVVLLLVATMVFLVLWLPYTGILLFAQCLQGSSGRLGAILVRLKPFFDAYFGPFRDKHRYWIGLMLLVRGILFVVYASLPSSVASVDLIATAVVVLCLLVYPEIGHIYRKTYLNRLEVSFLLNIVLLVVGTFYIRAFGGNQAVLAYISIGIAFIQFVGIVLFHAFTVLKAATWGREGRQWTHSRLSISHSQRTGQNQLEYKRLLPESSEGSRDGVKEQHVTYGDFREPVLKYVN